MSKLIKLKFNNTYSRLPKAFYQEIEPTSFRNPHVVAISEEVAELIGLDPGVADGNEFAEYISGKRKIPGSMPIAMYYTGYQFGVYNKDIGDGRAILLGEILNSNGEKWDLHLKGAGRTRFARQFDGRAVLSSCVREFLCCEAMYHLGIPTTRALCIIGSNEIVQRESSEMGAMLLRVAESHVRFGTFEGFYYKDDHDNVRLLADYIIDFHFSDMKSSDNKYLELFKEIVISTGELIALWQAFGFAHGVLNTDNMSILGLTLDYGPFGFVERFDPEYRPNGSDYHGRYSLRNQKSIGYWNLQKLGKCFSELLNKNEINDALDCYNASYKKKYQEIMRKKLGLMYIYEDDWHLIEIILECLHDSGVDYTNFFRNLSNFDLNDLMNNNQISDLFTGTNYHRWATYYCMRLKKERDEQVERKKLMDSVNPKYILRTDTAQLAIEKAKLNDYTEIYKILNILKKPYDEQPDFEEYSRSLPGEYVNTFVRCSS